MKTATVGEGLAFSGGSPPTLDVLARSTPAESLPDLLADLARALAVAFTRLITPTSSSVKSEPEADKLLTAEEAAPRLGLTVTALKRRRDLPFRRVIGGRTVRYSERGLTAWLKRRT